MARYIAQNKNPTWRKYSPIGIQIFPRIGYFLSAKYQDIELNISSFCQKQNNKKRNFEMHPYRPLLLGNIFWGLYNTKKATQKSRYIIIFMALLTTPIKRPSCIGKFRMMFIDTKIGKLTLV
ncbi:hypothetical protein [Parasediminibacterium sp. JCM 36343]|uniref:hypothetical protein n=1 Tax=Parasediminibacterium sp. JCM 36343 TaxID=3374279 RepID=UPI00397CBE8E